MTINEGKTDRLLRGGAGAVLAAAAAMTGITQPAGILMLVVAAVLLITAATGFCPVYRLLGISTVGRAHRVTSTRSTERTSR